MVYGRSAGHGGPPASQKSPSGDPGGPHTGPLGPKNAEFQLPNKGGLPCKHQKPTTLVLKMNEEMNRKLMNSWTNVIPFLTLY